MRVIVFGSAQNLEDAQKKLTAGSLDYASTPANSPYSLTEAHLVLDYRPVRHANDLTHYLGLSGKGPLILVNTVFTSLAMLRSGLEEWNPRLGGFNALAGFNHSHSQLMEVSSLKGTDIFGPLKELGIAYRQVEDRVGLVTPRVISMIINEAYYTVQEGTASREDIDNAMKLGTAYPYGPFEWSRQIGLGDVYHVLEAMYRDTGDQRYKICPLLKREYLLEK